MNIELELAQRTSEVARLLKQQEALSTFGSFAFREHNLLKILNEAARICADSLGVPYCKVCRYRSAENDLLVVAGCGWEHGVIGEVVSQADESSPQGRAYITREPVIIRHLHESNDLMLPTFYEQHGIISTVDVVIKGMEDAPYGVLEIDSPSAHVYNKYDIIFLTGFANVLAEAVATQTRVATLKALVVERNLLAQEMQHRVRNNLQLIQGMLDLHADTITEILPRQAIETIARRVMTLAQVYDHLLGVGMTGTIDFSNYLRTLCEQLPDLQLTRLGIIRLTCDANTTALNIDDVSTLGMVVAELVTNSYNHAFPGGRSGKIAITLVSSLDGLATLTIIDDGVGFNATSVVGRHGLTLARRLMTQLGGSLTVVSNPGTTWTLSFPCLAA